MSQAQTQTGETTDLEPVDFDTMSDLERGDVLHINGEQYPVIRLNDGLRALFTPPSPDVLADGKVRTIGYGGIDESDAGDPDENPTALAFVDDITDTDNPEEIPLLAENLDDVYVERDAADSYDLHRSHDSRTCPDCGNDTTRFEYGRNEGGFVQEVHKCNDSDCSAVWCYERDIPTDTTAEVTTYDPRSGDYDTMELSGVYRAVHTSRFKLDPTSNDKQEWHTAEEVAEFLNPKMNDEKDGERFGMVRENTRKGVTWKDDVYDWKAKIEFRKARGFN
jgi:hypothetical protein